MQSTGDTDINPTTVVAKSSQVVFGGLSKGRGEGEASAQRMNLVAGAVAGCAAGQATDMTGDLKTGHLLGAKPKVQFAAQLFGATIALFLAPALFILFAIASPCIITGETPCAYSAPSAAAWVAVAKVSIRQRLSPHNSNMVLGCHCSQASYPPFLWIHRHRPLNIRFHCRNREAPVGPSEVLGLDPQLERRGSRKYNLRPLKDRYDICICFRDSSFLQINTRSPWPSAPPLHMHG